jgi:hypothetical protein
VRNSVLLLAAAVAGLSLAAGCGGSSSTPAAPAASPSASASASATVAPTWVFNSNDSTATATFTAGSTPAPVAIPTGGDVGVALSVQFSAPSSGGTLKFSSAENNCCGEGTPDVSPTTLPADTATSGANAIVYFSIYNAGTSTVTFGSQTPAITVNALGLAGVVGADISCEFDYYESNNGAFKWTATGASVTTNGATSFTIPAATLSGGTVSFAPGQGVGAIACQ